MLILQRVLWVIYLDTWVKLVTVIEDKLLKLHIVEYQVSQKMQVHNRPLTHTGMTQKQNNFSPILFLINVKANGHVFSKNTLLLKWQIVVYLRHSGLGNCFNFAVSDIIGSYHQTLSNGWVEDAKQHRHVVSRVVNLTRFFRDGMFVQNLWPIKCGCCLTHISLSFIMHH